jgi:hypothetical protein
LTSLELKERCRIIKASFQEQNTAANKCIAEKRGWTEVTSAAAILPSHISSRHYAIEHFFYLQLLYFNLASVIG